MIGDSCVIGAMVDGNVCVVSAVNDGSCSPWVMCSCSVVSGNQIRDNTYYRSHSSVSRASHMQSVSASQKRRTSQPKTNT